MRRSAQLTKARVCCGVDLGGSAAAVAAVAVLCLQGSSANLSFTL
jgi:hypothetical protein